jgi:hypothetical protein
MILKALVKTSESVFRIYDHGDDWQILGKNFERWSSVWQNDYQASFNRAVDTIPDPDKTIFTL